jgi:hypothetical protein
MKDCGTSSGLLFKNIHGRLDQRFESIQKRLARGFIRVAQQFAAQPLGLL